MLGKKLFYVFFAKHFAKSGAKVKNKNVYDNIYSRMIKGKSVNFNPNFLLNLLPGPLTKKAQTVSSNIFDNWQKYLIENFLKFRKSAKLRTKFV